MREGVGNIVLYNMIIIFMFIVFGLLAATVTYYKAFKVNSMILDSIDKYEGFNTLAQTDIDNKLKSYGYRVSNENNCNATRKDATLVQKNSNTYDYCVYFYRDDTGGIDDNKKNGDRKPLYYNYSIVTYIYVELPIINEFKIPVHTKGERIYKFSDGQGDY